MRKQPRGKIVKRSWPVDDSDIGMNKTSTVIVLLKKYVKRWEKSMKRLRILEEQWNAMEEPNWQYWTGKCNICS